MLLLLVLALLFFAVAVVGLVIKGLLWLTLIGAVALLVTGVIAAVRRKTNA